MRFLRLPPSGFPLWARTLFLTMPKTYLTNTLLSTQYPDMTPSTVTPTDRWNGPEGRLWAEEVERFDRMGEPLLSALMAAAALQPGERVLDIGSGAGATTRAAAAAVGPRGSVIGIDPSTPLVALAR